MKLIKDNKVNEVNRVNNGQAVGLDLCKSLLIELFYSNIN